MMGIFTIPKSDLKALCAVFVRKVGILIAFMGFLFIDGIYVSERFPHSQWLLNSFAVITFLFLYQRAYPRNRKLMIYALFLGVLGEYLFSVYLGMYTYRLENVPWYVPFGHAAVYARVFLFSKHHLSRQYHKEIENSLTIVIIGLAISYLVFFFDVFGFVMTLFVFLLLWFRPKDRLYFYTMYVVVALLEIGGTAFGCWKWPTTAFGAIDFLPSHNPPSGISLFYFLLDIGCFVMYKLFHPQIWKRKKQLELIGNDRAKN